jgi:hypothetical protein
VLGCKQRGRGTTRNTDLLIDVDDVVLRRARRDREFRSDLLVAAAAGEQTQNFNLAVRETARPASPSARARDAGRVENRMGRLTVNATSVDVVEQALSCFRGVESWSMRARLAHGVVRIGGCQYTRSTAEHR